MASIKQKKLSEIIHLFKGRLIGNSFWAILSSVFQNIIFSLFFIVIARKYSASDFSSYIIANTLYGMIIAFSSLGLSQWFIREIKQNEFENKTYSLAKKDARRMLEATKLEDLINQISKKLEEEV